MASSVLATSAFCLAVIVLVSANRLSPNDTKLNRPKRVVNGTDAKISEFPYNVGVYVAADVPGSNGSSQCGGSIIGDRWVLTAAHCLYSSSKSSVKPRVFLQTAKHFTEDYIREPKGTKFYEAEDFVIHPGYDDDLGTNDIALVRSKRKLQFRRGLVEKIQLDWNSSVTSETAKFSGWGYTGQNQEPQVLQKMQVMILSTADDDFCKYVFKEVMDSSIICAQGVNSSGLGGGDSGGPLVAKGKQIGVAMAGIGEDDVNYPNLFARVSSYAPWIQFHCNCIDGYQGLEYSKGTKLGPNWTSLQLLVLVIMYLYF